ncbi:nuclear transport factor 2 family protein [Deinococcus hopiensis]|uniref:Putative lumazine-binding n=1 Tax=Deinococcus hopiensis KR-140 TaxID=695939 RepID=A0A1W1UYH4_9DEIO|nr:nuclear transport factor 2 family protein [Deinococcus hopiensis]SMB86143.1 Putative lumazine-binding [Deinococcus hopiensis KR-140]
MTVLTAETNIRILLQAYFDGLYTSDAQMLERVFHPHALYATAVDGQLVQRNMQDYLEVIRQRTSPASRHEPRTDLILQLEVLGPHTAFAKVQCSIAERHFTDLLSLVRVDGHWQIMAKVFHYEPLGVASCTS